MPYPALNDDGQTVTLDLHGATVDEALRLTEAVIAEAARRGRSQVRVIHGSSTSSSLYRNQTIKHALSEAVASGRFQAHIVDALQLENTLTFSLSISEQHDRRPLSMLEVERAQ